MDISTIYSSQLPGYFIPAFILFGVVATIGHAANRWLLPRIGGHLQFGNLPLFLVFASASGWALITTLLLLLGAAGWLYVSAINSVITILFATSVVYLMRVPAAEPFIYPELKACLYDVALLIILAGIFVAAIKPPGDWDDTMYHLPYARFFLERHGIETNTYLRYPYLPQHLHLVFAWLLGLRDEYFLQVVNAGFPALTVLGIFGLTRKLTGGRFFGYLAAAAYLSVPFVVYWVGYAYVDHALAFFVFSTLLGITYWHWPNKASIAWLWLAGIYLGQAIGIKVFGLMAAVPIGLYVAYRSRSIRTFTGFVLITSVLGGFWYIKSFVCTGNPFHPMGSEIFGYYLWNAEDLRLQLLEQASHGVRKTLINLPLAVAVPQVRAYCLWFGFASAICWRHLPSSLRIFYFFLASYYLVWFYLAQVQRYLLPALATGCVLAGWGLFRLSALISPLLSGRTRTVIGAVAACGVTLISWSWLQQQWQDYRKIKRIGFAQSLAQLGNNRSYSVMHMANLMASGRNPVLVQIGLENGGYFFRGIAIGDHFGPGRYSQWFAAGDRVDGCRWLKPPDALARGIRIFGAELLALDSNRFCVDAGVMRNHFDLVYQDANTALYRIRTQ